MDAEPPQPRIAFDHGELDATERRFWRDVWSATPAGTAAAQGIELRDFGPVLALAAAGLAESPMLNLVLGAGEPGGPTDECLGAAAEWMDARGVSYYVPLPPQAAEAAAAEAWLAEHGFERGYGWMKFVRGPTPPDLPERPEVEVIETGDSEDERDDFGGIVAAGFELPAWAAAMFSGLPGREGWRCYVAVVDGAPGAAAAMLEYEGVAEFGLAATLPSARGRGCQTSLLRRRILDAAAAGCHLLFVETGERSPDRPDPSYRNILRAGFEEAYLRPNWRRPPT